MRADAIVVSASSFDKPKAHPLHDLRRVVFRGRPTEHLSDSALKRQLGPVSYYVLDALLEWRARHDLGSGGTVDIRIDQLQREVTKRWGVQLTHRQVRKAKERLARFSVTECCSRRQVALQDGRKPWVNVLFVRALRVPGGVVLAVTSVRLIHRARDFWGGARKGAGAPAGNQNWRGSRGVNQEGPSTIKRGHYPPSRDNQDGAASEISSLSDHSPSGFSTKTPRAASAPFFPLGEKSTRSPVPLAAQASRPVKTTASKSTRPTLCIPPAPPIPENATDDQIVRLMAAMYRGAVGMQWRKRVWQPGRNQLKAGGKIYRLLLAAGRELQRLEVPPAAWADWSARQWWHMRGGDACSWGKQGWVGMVPKHPPVTWMFSAARLDKLDEASCDQLRGRFCRNYPPQVHLSDEEIIDRQVRIDRMLAEGEWVWSA